MPTFLFIKRKFYFVFIFLNRQILELILNLFINSAGGEVADKMMGANPTKLQELLEELA